MKVGIVSDSHGHADRLKAAVDAIRAGGAEAVVHCGDIGSLECLTVLAETGLPCYAVTGNMDRHVDELLEAAKIHGLCLDERMVSVPLADGRALAVAHGNNASLLRQLIACGRYAYVCHGHSHRASDVRDGGVRVINPGALHNCRTYTAAILDTDTDQLQLLTITLKT